MTETRQKQNRETSSESETSPSSDESGESRETSPSSEQPRRKGLWRKVAGGVGVFVVLALYFIWIGTEMGSHAVSGTSEMGAIFGAIFLGVVALIAGGAMMRRNN